MSYLRPRSQSISARSQFRPRLEGLEARYCLDSAPTIALTVTPLAYGCVLVSGQVASDTSASNLNVNIGGAANSGTQTDVDGMFSVVAHANSLGLIDASASDTSGTGNTSILFTCPPPTISSFQITYQGDGWFSFHGTVSDSWAPGMTVTFAGLSVFEGHSVTVNNDGSFNMSMQLAPGQASLVTCQVSDFWGNHSTANQFLNTTV